MMKRIDCDQRVICPLTTRPLHGDQEGNRKRQHVEPNPRRRRVKVRHQPGVQPAHTLSTPSPLTAPRPTTPIRILELVLGAEPAVSGNRGHALLEGIETTIRSTSHTAVLGTPWRSV